MRVAPAFGSVYWNAMADQSAERTPSTNRLAQETSPYLLQHATNPVDWYPWGPEALERAANEDKPILLSIGYSACHWCHVMERECFANPAIAELMNRSFVCIKVDREERPDLDDVYMAATVAITGAGGWPMTVFCTPEQSPFFAGTYFPPNDHQGRPGFATLLRRIAQLWEVDRDSLYRQGGELRDHLLRQSAPDPAQTVSAQSLELATGHLARNFDERHGGFTPAPKFPPTQALELLMRQFARTSNAQLLTMITRTLDAMYRGGIYDHLGGGFARYSTDDQWLVPHFEKMLYDNAQLARVYVHAYQITGNPAYANVVKETLDYVLREMQAEQGGYFSSQDADSEAEEGKYFVFTPRELRGVLEAEEVRLFCAYYDITEAGNWEGKSIPHTPRQLPEVAAELGLALDDAQNLLNVAKAKVFEYRKQRVAPATDDKILTGWNGLMISAMARAARVLDADAYQQSARRAAGFIWNHLRRDDGRLLRSARGERKHITAVLEDYAYLADALIDLYETTGEAPWLARAKELGDILQSDFLDPDTGAFFQTSHEHEPLIIRVRDGNDGALPNAGSVAARALLRLSTHFGDSQLRDVAVRSVRGYGSGIARKPHAYSSILHVVDDLLTPAVQLHFSGSGPALRTLQNAAAQVYLPHSVVHYDGSPADALWSTASSDAASDSTPALYICRNYACLRQVTTVDEVAPTLKEALNQNYAERAGYVALPAVRGCATSEGTRRYFERHDVNASSVRTLGLRAPVSVSRIGFGTQRVLESISDHQQALQLALLNGCNLIDTAYTYGNGSSERAVGNVLAELFRKQELTRDEVVVITKLTLDPNAPPLAQQLERSLSRLNLATVDVCLIHNPESLLERHSTEETLSRINEALVFLESAVARGEVVRHGLSSHVIHLPDAPISVADIHAAARAANATHFEVVQVPLNAEETEAAQPRWLELLSRLGLHMLTHRPLDTLKDGVIQRLFDAPEDPTSPSFATAVDAVLALEHEFRARLGAVLGAVPGIDLNPQQLLTWGERIGAQQIQSRERWNEFERGPLARELTSVISALDRAFSGKQIGQLWHSWRERYTSAMETLILAARQAASEATNRRNRGLRETLTETAPTYLVKPSLAQLAVDHASTQPLVVSTLVGMRMPEFARELTELLSLG
jgi:uncharacterized protein YyaL (SSP411 family)/aryl-alcohol dehydrogenase-like predicted oxidoreductase